MKYKNNGQWEEITIKALDSMPIGSIILFAGETIPNGWLVCDGRTLYDEEYPDLHNVLGGTGVSFNLPNFKGRVAVGYDSTDTDFNAIGKTGGSKYLQQHTHGYKYKQNANFASNNVYSVPGCNSAETDPVYANTSADGLIANAGTGNSGNLQPYLTVNYIIKALNTTPTMASVVNQTNSSTEDSYSCNYINNCNTYSTTETDTGKTWIDGKPIYRKVMIINQLPNAGSYQWSIGVANLDLVRINYGESYMTWVSPRTYSIVRSNPQIDFSIDNNKNLDVNTIDNSYVNWTAYVVVEYTKTTD